LLTERFDLGSIKTMTQRNTIHLTGKEPLIKDLASLVGYTGRRFTLRISEKVDCSRNGHWSGGYRSVFTMIRLADMAVLDLPHHQVFGQNNPALREVPLPAGFVVVEVGEGAWKDMQIWVGPQGAAPMLPAAKSDLTSDEKIVLYATATQKNSYGGRTDIRFSDARENTGITRERYDAAQASLISKKLLNKAGAVTPDGRNANTYQYGNMWRKICEDLGIPHLRAW
jgi:hypothetical protein